MNPKVAWRIWREPIGKYASQDEPCWTSIDQTKEGAQGMASRANGIPSFSEHWKISARKFPKGRKR